MRFSLQLFGMRTPQFEPLAVAADGFGFDTLWLSDHVVTPLEFAKRYPYAESGDPGYRPETPLTDVVATLSFIAGRTRRIRLGSGVLILPLRNPFLVARGWATLQEHSGGRAVLGVGSGWMEEEFTALGMSFSGRGARMDEMLDVIDLAWDGGVAEYAGEHYRFPPVHFGAPLQPRVPVVFGGHSGRALRRVAARGDGWFGPNLPLEDSVAFRDRIERLREEVGTLDRPFTYHVRLYGDVDEANVRRYEEAGFTHLVFSPFARLPREATDQQRRDALAQVAERLLTVWPPPDEVAGG